MDVLINLKETEDPVKMLRQAEKTVPGLQIELNEEKSVLEGRASFEGLWKKIREKGLEEVFREELKRNRKGEKTYLYLSKISASKGKIEVYGGSAIGKIELMIDWKQAKEV